MDPRPAAPLALHTDYIRDHIRTVPDWPAPGVQFRDITPLLQNPKVFRVLIDEFVHRYFDVKPDAIAGLDARGFILGSVRREFQSRYQNSLLGMAWLPGDQALAVRESLKPWMARFDFASCVPFARQGAMAEAGAGDRVGLLFCAASDTAASPEELAALEGLLGLHGADTLRYADKKRGQRRAARLVRRGEATTLEGVVLAGDTSAESWLKTLLQEELPAQTYGRLLLVPGAKAPVAVQSRGKSVCTCFNVTDAAITAELAHCHGTDDDRLAQLQGKLRCGTNCGSCLPEVKRMVRQSIPTSQRDATLSS